MSVLYARLHSQVAVRPDAPAVVEGDRVFSYSAFDALIDAKSRDFAGNRVLGWLSHNSAEMLATLFACARSHARFVPLNWRLTASELAALATHAEIDGLYAAPETAELCRAVCAQWQPAQQRSPSDVNDLLLVYTSGTTGAPKGALHTQAAMVANIDAAIDAQDFDVTTRTLAVLPLFHVGGLCIQVLPTLVAGGTVRLQPRFDADAWFDDVAVWRPTTSLLVPAAMRALIAHQRWAAADLSSLHFINCGSQIVPRPLIEAFHARGVPVAQVYGATETGPVTLVLRPGEALKHVGSVGRPALHVQVRLVNGEVQVMAPNLARGYHRRPDDDAFAEGWFRSGDLARVDGDGFYEIVGRAKELIISGGENIHPAEIETIALADAAVAEAAVIGLPDERWGEVAVLAVVPRAGCEIDLERLQAAFAATLARFKHPRRVVVLHALPKTALGKVRKADLAVDLQQARDP